MGLVGDGLAHELNGAVRAFHDSGDALEQRGFAGAVGAQDGDDLAFLNLEGDAAEGMNAAVSRFQVFNLQYRCHYSFPPRYARITSGSLLTSAGVPTAMVLPKLSTVQ